MRLIGLHTFTETFVDYIMDLVDDYRLSAESCGIDGFLFKDFTRNKVLDMINDSMHKCEFILNNNNEFIGAIAYRHQGHTVNIDCLYISPDYRNLGHEKEVLNYFMSKNEYVYLVSYYNYGKGIYEPLFSSLENKGDINIYKFSNI